MRLSVAAAVLVALAASTPANVEAFGVKLEGISHGSAFKRVASGRRTDPVVNMGYLDDISPSDDAKPADLPYYLDDVTEESAAAPSTGSYLDSMSAAAASAFASSAPAAQTNAGPSSYLDSMSSAPASSAPPAEKKSAPGSYLDSMSAATPPASSSSAPAWGAPAPAQPAAASGASGSYLDSMAAASSSSPSSTADLVDLAPVEPASPAPAAPASSYLDSMTASAPATDPPEYLVDLEPVEPAAPAAQGSYLDSMAASADPPEYLVDLEPVEAAPPAAPAAVPASSYLDSMSTSYTPPSQEAEQKVCLERKGLGMEPLEPVPQTVTDPKSYPDGITVPPAAEPADYLVDTQEVPAPEEAAAPTPAAAAPASKSFLGSYPEYYVDGIPVYATGDKSRARIGASGRESFLDRLRRGQKGFSSERVSDLQKADPNFGKWFSK